MLHVEEYFDFAVLNMHDQSRAGLPAPKLAHEGFLGRFGFSLLVRSPP